MPDLIPSPSPIGTIPLVTTEAPRSPVNPNDIARSGAEMGRGLKEAGSGLMDLATPIAEAQAASDLQNQKVTIGPDGKIQVINPARSFAFGRAGEAAGAAIQAGTVAQVGATVDTALTDIHMKHLGDPAGQSAANEAFVAGLKGVTGNPLIDAAVTNRAREAAAQHYDHNLEFTTRLNVGNTERSLNATIESAKESLAEMARGGIAETDPQWVKQKGILDAAQNEQQNNPLLKRTPEEIALDKSQTTMRWTGERLVGSLPKVIDTEGMIGAKAKVDEMLANPALEPKTRAYLRMESGRILAEAQPKWQEDNRNYDQGIAGAERDIASGRLKADDPTIVQMRQYGSDHHMERAPDFEAWIYQHHLTSNLAPSTPDQRNAVMGIPHTPTPGANVPAPDAGGPSTGVTPQAMSNAILGQESGGNPNSPTSVDNAHGMAQIIPATFNQYARPGEKIDNPADNLAVHQRIIADYMQRYNGDPARVAVAYFSGPGNVSDPGAPLPYKTNSRDGNGKSVDSYVKDVAARLGGQSIAQQRAAAGQPQFTPEEIKKYGPALFASAFQKENQDPAEKLSFFNAKIGMMESGLKVGAIPSQEDIADIYRTMGDNANDPRFQEKFANWEGLLKSTIAQSMPPAQQQALVGGAMAAAQAPGADMLTKGMAAAYTRNTDEWDKQWKSAPVSMASKFMGTPVTPLDMTSAQGMAQGIAQRSAAASAILARRGEAVSVFEGDDLGQVKGVLQNGTVQQKQALLDGLSAIKDPAVMNATMAKLGNDQAGGSFKVAAALMDQNQPAAAQDILEGQQILAQDKTYAPKESSFSGIRKGLGDALPSSDFGDEDSRGAVESAARAVYAKKSFAANDTSQEFNQQRFDESLQEVTGGVRDFRGSKVFGQRYGATDDDLDKGVRSLTDTDFANARAPNGESVPGTILSGGNHSSSWWNPFATSGDWRLESRGRPGDGMYYVYGGSGQKSYLRDATTGGKFILDMSKK